MSKKKNDDNLSKFTKEMHLSRFLHQNLLMWGRLQTSMAIQTAAIALAFLVRESPILASSVIGFGLAISGCQVWLYILDRRLRDEHLAASHKELVGDFHQRYRVAGMRLFFAVVAIFLIADLVTVVGLWCDGFPRPGLSP